MTTLDTRAPAGLLGAAAARARQVRVSGRRSPVAVAWGRLRPVAGTVVAAGCFVVAAAMVSVALAWAVAGVAVLACEWLSENGRG